jgi:hypothetical protein
MALSSAARSRWILAVVLLACIGGVWWMRRRTPHYPVAYVGDQAAALWSTTAQVRQTVATLHYGERVAVLRRTADQSQVRADDGVQGWIDNRLLMDPALWQKSADVLAGVRAMPVQASGRTRTVSNVHVEPGRDTPRIFQFGRNVPVVVFERRSTIVPQTADSTTGDEASSAEGAAKPDAERSTAGEEKKEDKKEDWLLVSRVTPGKTVGGPSPALGASPSGAPPASPIIPSSSSGPPSSASSGSGPVSAGSSENGAASVDTPIAGWVLARFVELEPPEPIPDYSNAAGMHVVAWVVLNTVPDAGGEKPQYLVAGTRGGEGQPCDFTLLRAYTWGEARQRYETAYVESDLCGQFPIRVSETPAGPEFNFRQADQPAVLRAYRMKQTVIRRVMEGGAAPRKAPSKPQPKSSLKSQLKSPFKSPVKSGRNPKSERQRKTRSAAANAALPVHEFRFARFARSISIAPLDIEGQASPL